MKSIVMTRRATWVWTVMCLLALTGCQSQAPDGYQGYLEADYAYIAAPVAGRLTELPLPRGASSGVCITSRLPLSLPWKAGVTTCTSSPRMTRTRA